MKGLRVAVLGCGYWGKNLVRVFAQSGHLAAICDQDPVLTQALSEKYAVPVLEFDTLLSPNNGIDGIAIATPAITHASIASQALLAGKHVFVEKPLALNMAEAETLSALADKHQKILMVGHLLQYHPAFIELKRLVDRGHLGKLQYIYSNRLNLGKFRQEENILWSFAPHDISMILALANALPERVYASGSCHLNQKIQDVTTTHLFFKKDLQAHIFVSWLHPYKEQKLVVVGEHGMAVFDDGRPWAEKLMLYPQQITWMDGCPQPHKAEGLGVKLEEQEPLVAECAHFISCMHLSEQAQKVVSPLSDAQEGMGVLRVLEAAQESLHTQAAVSLSAPKREVPKDYMVHETAIVDEGVQIGTGTKIWHFSHILGGCCIGAGCVIGQNVMIGPDVVVGDRCKIQNNVSLYKGVTLAEGVFCGPSAVFTNVYNPRAEVERKEEYRPTMVEVGVSIGANATIVCGHRLGAYSFIGAGAVVTKDVKAHALVVGNPAKQIGWVSHAGEILGADLRCPREGRQYQCNAEGLLIEITQEAAATCLV